MQNHINKMSELTDENNSNIRSLEIMSPIRDIYNEIERFLESNHYLVRSITSRTQKSSTHRVHLKSKGF